jgi:TolA-binding protein
MAFIENYDAGNPYIQNTYEKTVKPELQKATLDDLNKVPNYDKIKSLFPKGSNDIVLQLAEKINERKSKYSGSSDNTSLFESLGTTGWKNIDLTKTATTIQNRISTKFNTEQKLKQISEQEVVKTQTIQTSTQVDELQTKIVELQQQYNNLKNNSKIVNIQSSVKTLRGFVFALFLALVFIIVALLFFYFRIFRKKVVNIVKNSDRIKQYISGMLGTQTNVDGNVTMFEDKLQKLERQFGELQEKVNELVKKVDELIRNLDVGVGTGNHEVKYLKGKSGKTFSRIESSPEGANWCLKGDTNQFEYCGTLEAARSNYNAIFDNVSETTGNVQNAKGVETKEKGTVKVIDNIWEVTTPAKIKFV